MPISGSGDPLVSGRSQRPNYLESRRGSANKYSRARAGIMRAWVSGIGGTSVLTFLLVLSLSSLGQSAGALPTAVHPALSATYEVTFVESGLPAGTNWSVHLAFDGCGCQGVHGTFHSDTASLSISVTNGTYRYTVLAVSGFYVNSTARGTFTISGSNGPTISIVFHPLVLYGVEFSESGLPSGTNWTVSVAGNARGQEAKAEHVTQTTHGSSMNFTLPNGTYRYSVARVAGSFFSGPSHGTFTVAGASPGTVTVGFVTPPTYQVTFTETGLAPGTNWTVRLAGFGGVPIREVRSSTTDAISFGLPTGTYRYEVAEVLGYALNGSAGGSIQVTDGSIAVPVPFHSLSPGAFYTVTFEESGLVAGTHWTVRVVATHTFGHSRQAEQTSTASTLVFELQNGTYDYRALAVHGYVTNESLRSFTVAGQSPPTIVVSFSAIPTYSVTFSESGLPSGTNWSVLIHTQPGGWSAWPVRVTEVTNQTAFSIALPNGSYCYRFYAVHGYEVSSGTVAGSFTVAGASPPGISVGFTAKA